jgi:hypothetical protein
MFRKDSCRRPLATSGRYAPVLLALLLMLTPGLAWAQPTGTISGAASPFPSNSHPQVGDNYNVRMSVTNTSQSSAGAFFSVVIQAEPPALPEPAARFILDCNVSNCAIGTGGTAVVFDPTVAGQCESGSASCVTGCTAGTDPVSGSNTVEITTDGTCMLGALTNNPSFATARVRQVAAPASFFMRASAGLRGSTGTCNAGLCSNTGIVQQACGVDSDCNFSTLTGTAAFSANLAPLEANIQIAPATATNEINTNHTLTITVNAVNGILASGNAVPLDGTATASIVSGPGSFVGSPTCTYTVPAGGATTASCTVVITKTTPGTTVVSATSDISMTTSGSGFPSEGIVTRTTNTTDNTNAGGSGNASKTWVDANIQITPATAANAVGTNHTLTGHVNVNDGTGFVNAPDNTIITFQLLAPIVGSFQPPGSLCLTAGGTGSCTVVITSNATGTSTVEASTTVSVGGVSLTRTTGDGLPGDGPNAQKEWVKAKIEIAPSATNLVGANHTFTVTVQADTGGGYAAFQGASVTVTLANGGSAVANPPGPFNGTTDVNGQFEVVFTSATAGTVTGHASATLTINGVAFAIETDGLGDNSGDAVKTFVDAYIQITPQNATNAVGTNHTLTITVNANPNTGTIVAGTATATILGTSTTGSFVPAGNPTTCAYPGGLGLSSCTVVITSAVAGTTDVEASAGISLQGVAGSLTRTTGTVANVTAGCPQNCNNASKTWVDAYIQIAPPTATNLVGTNHTLTITVNATNGGILANGTATASLVNPPGTTGSFVGLPTCDYMGGGATASCSVVITSSAVGLSSVHAASGISFSNAAGTVQRETSTAANVTAGCLSNCSDASKTWVDAFIQITPQTATNPINTNHTLTITVNANPNTGTIAAGTATATILGSSTTGSFVPAGNPTTCAYPGGLGSSSCTVVITSAVVGTTDVQASAGIGLVGVSGTLTRTTGTAENVTAGCTVNCNNAQKVWVSPCDLGIDKTCEVESTYTCTKPITALIMQLDPLYAGGCVRIAGTAGSTPFDKDNICPGNVVTVSGYDGSQGNDVFWNVCQENSGPVPCDSSNALFIAQSTFHLSCSDSDMNSADDCGNPEGNGKGSVSCLPGGNNASCFNNWVLAGIDGPTNSPPSASLACPGFVTSTQTECTVTPQPYVCTKPITSLTMTWDGTANGYPACVHVSATAGANNFDMDGVCDSVGNGGGPADTITVDGYDGSQGNDVFWNICVNGSASPCDPNNPGFIGQSDFHLSCSDSDMNSGDDCGKTEGDAKGSTSCAGGPCINAWIFDGMSGPAGSPPLDCAFPNGSAPVTYTYVVTNKSATPVTGVTVTDAVTANGVTQTITNPGNCVPTDLAGNQSFSCQSMDMIGVDDTTDIATATDSTGSCTATSKQVTVYVGACPTSASALTTKDQDVKWKISAPTGTSAEIGEILITWPQGTNGVLQEVKRAGDSIYKTDTNNPADITQFKGTTNQRTIQGGKTDEVKFHFKNKPVANTGYDITIKWANLPARCDLNITQ